MKASYLVATITAPLLAMAVMWSYPNSVAAQDKFGSWGDALNLGSAINSKCANLSCETERPAVSRDNLSLYFDFNRPGFGGHDIWVSHRDSVDAPLGNAAKPRADRQHGRRGIQFQPVFEWTLAVFGSDRLGGCGGLEIGAP